MTAYEEGKNNKILLLCQLFYPELVSTGQTLTYLSEELVKQGMAGLHYLRGKDLLGSDGEAATDGSHPNDLGFMRYADAYAKVLDPLLR